MSPALGSVNLQIGGIDSASIVTVVRSRIKLKKLGGTLRLPAVKCMVGGVLKFTQIDRTIEMFPTAEEAVQGLPMVPKS